MTVNFIASAFEKMGEYPKSVRLMLDIFTNESVGYAYLDFYDPESVMTRLNGKIIPNTRPVSNLVFLFFFINLCSHPKFKAFVCR